MKRKTAFTLVETLTVLAIILILVGITLSVILGSKERAKIVAEISGMRQISQAASIYQADYDGVHPLSVAPVINADYLSLELAQSPLDFTQNGLLVEFWNNVAMPSQWRKQTSGRISYIGVGDSNMPFSDFEANIRDKEGAGWLVSFTRAHRDSITGNNLKIPGSGPYLRATLEGSVLHRHKQSAFGVSWKEWFRDEK